VRNGGWGRVADEYDWVALDFETATGQRGAKRQVDWLEVNEEVAA